MTGSRNVANISLMTKRLKRTCGSGRENSQNISMLRVSTHWWSDGTSVSMSVEDRSVCDVFTDAPSYVP
jgi:hypothetical protein